MTDLSKDITEKLDTVNRDIDRIKELMEKANEFKNSDPSSALNKSRIIAEAICRLVYSLEHPEIDERIVREKTLNELIIILYDRENLIPKIIAINLNTIKAFGNFGSHDQHNSYNNTSFQPCFEALTIVTEWFFQSFLESKKVKPVITSSVSANSDNEIKLRNIAYTINSIGIELATIPSGGFIMGSPQNDNLRSRDETQHKVTLSKGLIIGKTVVTQGQWIKVMGNNPSYFKEFGENHPVENVSWFDAIKFLNKLSEMDGLSKCYREVDREIRWNIHSNGYRLPTEAEWEYSARAGSTTRFYNGDKESLLAEIAWYKFNSANSTHLICQKEPNSFGLYDVLGNVWEWVWDWHDKYSPVELDPTGPVSGSSRVCRGGSFKEDAKYCRLSHRRAYYSPSIRDQYLGFRVARSLLNISKQ